MESDLSRDVQEVRQSSRYTEEEHCRQRRKAGQAEGAAPAEAPRRSMPGASRNRKEAVVTGINEEERSGIGGETVQGPDYHCKDTGCH